MNKVYVVGMGPGNLDMMTVEAKRVLEECDVIVGYTVYVELLKEIFSQKEYASTPMKQEIARCRMCYELAKEGKNVAMVCSGDAGVYGMAAPMYELLKDYEGIELVIIPGLTAALSGAAMLGAPLNHDFCLISLSDLLTPFETIEKRLRAAIAGDFAIAIYNPSSIKRADYLRKACQIMISEGADLSRACGYVCNIGRENPSAHTCTLGELMNTEVDMFTTVFIGNSKSLIIDGKLVTSRGYKCD